MLIFDYFIYVKTTYECFSGPKNFFRIFFSEFFGKPFCHIFQFSRTKRKEHVIIMINEYSVNF